MRRKNNNAKVFILRKMPPKSLSVRAIKEITESISLTSTKNWLKFYLLFAYLRGFYILPDERHQMFETQYNSGR